MKLSELELLRLLPGFLRGDETAAGIAAGVDKLIRRTVPRLPVLRKWDQIGNMTEAQLDEMAWELGTLWYDKGASIETKRRLILNSDIVWSLLGTRWAVEEVMEAYLGKNSQLMEFWEYEGGRPHYYGLAFDNFHVTEDDLRRFLHAHMEVKRRSQWLEFVLKKSHTETTVMVGAIATNHTAQRNTITPPPKSVVVTPVTAASVAVARTRTMAAPPVPERQHAGVTIHMAALCCSRIRHVTRGAMNDG